MNRNVIDAPDNGELSAAAGVTGTQSIPATAAEIAKRIERKQLQQLIPNLPTIFSLTSDSRFSDPGTSEYSRFTDTLRNAVLYALRDFLSLDSTIGAYAGKIDAADARAAAASNRVRSETRARTDLETRVRQLWTVLNKFAGGEVSDAQAPGVDTIFNDIRSELERVAAIIENFESAKIAYEQNESEYLQTRRDLLAVREKNQELLRVVETCELQNAEIERLRDRNAPCVADLERANAAVAEYEKKQKRLESEVENYEMQLVTLNNRIIVLESMLTQNSYDYKTKYSNLVDERDALQESYVRMQAELEYARRMVDEKTKIVNDYELMLDGVRTVTKEYEDQISAFREQVQANRITETERLEKLLELETRLNARDIEKAKLMVRVTSAVSGLIGSENRGGAGNSASKLLVDFLNDLTSEYSTDEREAIVVEMLVQTASNLNELLVRNEDILCNVPGCGENGSIFADVGGVVGAPGSANILQQSILDTFDQNELEYYNQVDFESPNLVSVIENAENVAAIVGDDTLSTATIVDALEKSTGLQQLGSQRNVEGSATTVTATSTVTEQVVASSTDDRVSEKLSSTVTAAATTTTTTAQVRRNKRKYDDADVGVGDGGRASKRRTRAERNRRDFLNTTPEDLETYSINSDLLSVRQTTSGGRRSRR